MKRIFFLFFYFSFSLFSRNPFAFEWDDACIAKAVIEERQMEISFHQHQGAIKTHIIKKAPST